uniref:NADH-ubiquinone oxidoreductase chain 6 n=1 Tax=Badis badis TaxID=248959 RepID=A0A679ER51_9TELE|nr:NADH dehydrogenase subunit 6 [Badis badis]
MSYIMFFLLIGLVFGVIAVASNPAPYFGALGLVMVAGIGCWVLVGHGGSFLSLVLFLVYLGGMLVVFAYSAALAAEPYPESWGDFSVVIYILVYVVATVLVTFVFWMEWYNSSWTSVFEVSKLSVLREDTDGVAFMYSSGGKMLVVGAWVLLLTLLVVLELTRGLSRGTLRAV